MGNRLPMLPVQLRCVMLQLLVCICHFKNFIVEYFFYFKIQMNIWIYVLLWKKLLNWGKDNSTINTQYLLPLINAISVMFALYVLSLFVLKENVSKYEVSFLPLPSSIPVPSFDPNCYQLLGIYLSCLFLYHWYILPINTIDGILKLHDYHIV